MLSVSLSLVLHSSPWAVRPKSGEPMRNKWVLSGMHGARRYTYQGLSDGLYLTHLHLLQPQLSPSTSSSSSSSLPAILSEECGNAWGPEMEGMRERDEGKERDKRGEDAVCGWWQVCSPCRHLLLSSGGLEPQRRAAKPLLCESHPQASPRPLLFCHEPATAPTLRRVQ